MRANTYVATVSWWARTRPGTAVPKHCSWRQQSHRERHAEGRYLLGCSPLRPPIQVCRAGLWDVTCWGSGEGWGAVVSGEPPDGADPRTVCCRINVLQESSLGYLVFAWCLALIKGICHVQRALLSSASACPYVISLFKQCLRLCQVSTVALSTRV